MTRINFDLDSVLIGRGCGCGRGSQTRGHRAITSWVRMSTLVPTLCWVPKGVSKEDPDKVGEIWSWVLLKICPVALSVSV